MNQGLFGLPGGPAQGVRKLAGQVRSGFNTSGATYTSALAAAGLNSNGATTVALSAGIRTRLLSINGRGALRFALLNNGTAGTPDIVIEVLFDGVRGLLTPTLSVLSGGFALYVGGVNLGSSSAMLDFQPFDSSLEIWTTTSAPGNYQHGFLIDLHQ
jgi:hypothetical protein